MEIKKCTQSVVKAIEVLSTKFDNTIGGLIDQMTSISRQMNRKVLYFTESIGSLQTMTNNLKTALYQKAYNILNKTEAVFEKVKPILKASTYLRILHQLQNIKTWTQTKH